MFTTDYLTIFSCFETVTPGDLSPKKVAKIPKSFENQHRDVHIEAENPLKQQYHSTETGYYRSFEKFDFKKNVNRLVNNITISGQSINNHSFMPVSTLSSDQGEIDYDNNDSMGIQESPDDVIEPSDSLSNLGAKQNEGI